MQNPLVHFRNCSTAIRLGYPGRRTVGLTVGEVDGQCSHEPDKVSRVQPLVRPASDGR